MKKNIYIILIISLIISLYLYFFYESRDKQYTYLFLQQNEDSCHISSWYNYNVLQKMRTKTTVINKAFINTCAFYDKYYWYSYDSMLTTYWHNFMSLFSRTNPIYGSNRYIREFVDILLNNGVVFPHIYIDKDATVSFFKKRGLASIGLFYFTPNSCIDYNSIKNIIINLYIHTLKLKDIFDLPERDISFPCFIQNNKTYIYSKKHLKFINYLGNISYISDYYDITPENIYFIQNIDNKTKSKHYRIKLNNSFIDLLIPTFNTTNKKIYAQQYVNTTGIGISSNLDDSLVYIIYGASNLYWTLFLCGVNYKNTLIHKDDILFKYYMIFKHMRINNDPNSYNIWGNNNKLLHKDNIFQYHLTTLFKNNTILYDRLLLIFSNLPIDLLSIYDELGEYYNKDGIQYKETLYKHFILGKDQMLSYLISIIIWLLWNRCISIQNFAKALQTSVFSGHILWIIFYHFITKKYNNYSIMDGIFDINIILAKTEQEYVSICSHSYVISYKKDLIDLQISTNKNIEYKDIFSRLPAIIDSWNGEYFKENLFYIR
tara:strand:- start:7272 stop:8906 length:1635 start_codon:yes stop_codon:yes gene_type:complete